MSVAKAAVRTYASLKTGESASLKRTITAKDVDAFAELSGDHNPLHVEPEYAKETQFKRVVVHGMFLGALVSQLVGMNMPGAYSLLMKETLEFKKPVFIDDTVAVVGTIVHKSPAARLVEISIEISRKSEVIASCTVHVRLLQ